MPLAIYTSLLWLMKACQEVLAAISLTNPYAIETCFCLELKMLP